MNTNLYVTSVAVIAIAILIVLAVMWEKGITYMNENHPDYKGEDLFGDDEDK